MIRSGGGLHRDGLEAFRRCDHADVFGGHVGLGVQNQQRSERTGRVDVTGGEGSIRAPA